MYVVSPSLNLVLMDTLLCLSIGYSMRGDVETTKALLTVAVGVLVISTPLMLISFRPARRGPIVSIKGREARRYDSPSRVLLGASTLVFSMSVGFIVALGILVFAGIVPRWF